MELASPEELPEGETLLTKEGHLIEKLEVGKQYVLRETLGTGKTMWDMRLLRRKPKRQTGTESGHGRSPFSGGK